MSLATTDLKDRVAVITGINGLLGPVWAQALLSQGMIVWGLDLKLEPRPAVVELAQRYPNHFHLAIADVLDRVSIETAREQIATESRFVEVLVNNAGIDQPPRPGIGWRVEEFPWEEFKHVVEVNLGGAFQCSQVFGAAMVTANRGSIINIGSLYASVSPDERNYDHFKSDPPFIKPPAYGASKAGLLNLTGYLAAHWGKHGIRVNMLSPGGVSGGQDLEFRRKFCARVPLARMAEHGDLIGPLVFLASDASAYVTGLNLTVDGGYTLW